MRQVLQAFRRSSRLNRGFTLIELLIVVAIIAILAAIAIPQFGKYRTESAKRACLADVRNALSMCAAALATDPTKTSCEAGTDYPDSTTNATNIEVTVDDTTGEITATGTCSDTAGGVEVQCRSVSGSIQCTIGG